MNLGLGGTQTDVVRIESLVWSRLGHDETIGFLYARLNMDTEPRWYRLRQSITFTTLEQRFSCLGGLTAPERELEDSLALTDWEN